MVSNHLSIGQNSRGAPPHWAVRTVKGCVLGILGLPLAVPLLLAASAAFGAGADPYRKLGFFVSLAVWLGLFVTAQYLTAVFPPVPRRR
jgi:ABC-type transport system involved in cytochrome c biogenesis permease component